MTAPLAAIEALLVDLDGVLYVDDELVPGAREAVVRMRAAGLALRFVTNTTSHSRAQTLAKLTVWDSTFRQVNSLRRRRWRCANAWPAATAARCWSSTRRSRRTSPS